MSIENPPSPTAATAGEMTIRDAVEADLPAIIEIYNAAIATRMATAQLEPVTVEERRNWLKEHSPDRYPFWVLEIDGQIAGWLSLQSFLPRCAYRGTTELSVYVDQKFRRRGVARRLMEEALARAPLLGINAMVGLIFAHNEPSLRLFAQLGFERWGLLSRIARLDETERDLVVMGRHCAGPCSHGPAGCPISAEMGSHIDAPQARGYSNCFELMHTLVQCRQAPIQEQLGKIRKLSMLHLDVLFLIYHFAKTCSGHVLEIGAFLGGATVAATLGVRESAKHKALIAIEPGGSLKHPQLGTRDIYRDLQRNLRKQRVSDAVTLIKGRSFDPATISAVCQVLGPDEIGLLIIDADGGVKRDIRCYADKLAESCPILIDDYYGPAAKAGATRKDVDELVEAGCLEPLGFYGWGTWVGRWRGKGKAIV